MSIYNIRQELKNEMIIKYKAKIGHLKQCLELAKDYRKAYKIADEELCKQLLANIEEKYGISCEPVSVYSDEFSRSQDLTIFDATPDQIMLSIRDDIKFLEKGMNYTQIGSYDRQVGIFVSDNTAIHESRTFERTDYSDKKIYCFKTTKFGTSPFPKFTFPNLDSCAEYFSDNIEEAQKSKDVRGSIWKALKERKKGRTMFGYIFSLNENVNKL